MWHTMLLQFIKNCKVNSIRTFSWLHPNTANNAVIHLQTLRCCVEREVWFGYTSVESHESHNWRSPFYSIFPCKQTPALIYPAPLRRLQPEIRGEIFFFYIYFMMDSHWLRLSLKNHQRLRKCKHFSKEPFRLEKIVWRLQMNNIWDSLQAQWEGERVNRVSLPKSNGRRLYVGNRVWIRLQCDEKKARAEEKRGTRRRRGACVTHSHTEWAFEMHGRASS